MNNSIPDSPKLRSIVDGQGPPVILIHGMAGSLEGWDLVRPALVEAGYQVFALDLPGHGESEKPSGREAYHVRTIFEWVARWIEGLELQEPPVLVGHSLGGYLSCQFVLRRPDEVRALVLADPFFSKSQLFPFMRATVQQPWLSASLYRLTPGWVLRSMVTWVKNHTMDIPPAVLRQILLDVSRAAPQILYTPPTIDNLEPQLGAIQVPTLVIWGQNDLTLSPTSYPRMVASLPDADGFEVPRCGHTPHLTHAEDFLGALLPFLDGDRLSERGSHALRFTN